MPLTEAIAWLRRIIIITAAQDDAIRALEQASAQGVEATLIIGTSLTSDQRCYLARWTGNELVLVQLTPALQEDLRVNPAGLFQQLEAPGDLPNATVDRRVTLSDLQFALIDVRDHQMPWTGTCRFALQDVTDESLETCVLRAQYFRSDLPHSVNAYWQPNIAPLRIGGQMRFQFIPIAALTDPQEIFGSAIVFVQLYAADDWEKRLGVRPISNVLGGVVGDY